MVRVCNPIPACINIRMDYYLLTVVVVTALSIGIHLLGRSRRRSAANKACVPPFSLGLPFIGHTTGLLRSLRANRIDRFFRDRIDRYGPVSKLWLFGYPTALLAGPAGNKFVFFNQAMEVTPPASILRIMGEKSLLAIHGDDHRRVRGALMEFLRPDMLKTYIGRIDDQVRRHIEENWAGRTAVTVLPLMKRLTFDIISALALGNEKGAVPEALDHELMHVFEGMLATPLNLPFTAYRRSLLASRRARRLLERIIQEKQTNLDQGKASPKDDPISLLLSMSDHHGQRLLTNEEIGDNTLGIMIGAFDSTATLMTFMVRQLANDPKTLIAMVQEHQEIAKNKAEGEALVWEDLSKMTFTWRVAQETLRTIPPIFGNRRIAVQDTEFDGYCIPKGWQVFWAANVTHMDPSIFQEPAKFDPSRFETIVPSCSFVPFGGGPRMCIGVDLVRIQTLVVMHHLVRHFTWKLCCKDDIFVNGIFPSPLHGLPIQLEQHTSL